jgi:hypothetical protein
MIVFDASDTTATSDFPEGLPAHIADASPAARCNVFGYGDPQEQSYCRCYATVGQA